MFYLFIGEAPPERRHHIPDPGLHELGDSEAFRDDPMSRFQRLAYRLVIE